VRLALREMRRRPGRFAAAGVTLILVAVLLMFLGGLLDGLIRSATGAYEAQDADVVVYAATAEDSLLRSRIPGELRAQVEAVDGVAAVGGLGVAQLGGRLPDAGVRDLVDVAVLGYELPPIGVPEPPGPGEVYADDVLEADGVEEGMVLEVGPARTPVRVVGFVSDTVYSGQGSLWAAPETWREVQAANRPDAQLAPDAFQALVVQVTEGADAADVAAAIDQATDGATASLTKADAIESLPGVADQRATFNQVLGVTLLVAVLVIALFFALLTVERTGLYGVLKAIGASSLTLFGGTVVQALVLTGVASIVAAGLALLAAAAIPPGTVPYVATTSRLLSSTVLLLLAAVAGSAFSLRRVLRVDPASAIGSSQ
jgi:putative ABC transport system permease protein